MPSRRLSQDYPWVSSPVIISAPMSGFVGPALAHEVSKAGGVGFLGGLPDTKALYTAVQDVTELVTGTRLPQPDASPLPIGLGALLFAQKLDEVVALVKVFRPVAVWLFAAHESADFKRWTEEIRKASNVTKIWIQIGSVTGAVKLAQSCKPDVLVLQGADAGGHGGEKGAGIISLIPETLYALQRLGLNDISIVAAGGIADGSSVAAALTLGADGVVMGTRFLAAEETTVHPSYQAAILGTEDGGQTTVRAKVFDELAGPNTWPRDFDGRALIAQSYQDHIKGISIEGIRKSHAEAKQTSHLGFDQEDRRAAIWAGTGVGLVREKAPASEILTEVRQAAKTALERAMTIMG